MKLSFKKQPRETGLAGVGYPHPNTSIKIDGKKVGEISAPTWMSKDDLWHIMFMVKKSKLDNNPNCDWRWIFLKKGFDTEIEGRNFIKENIMKIAEKYTFHFIG
jgi:hypothetical protein